MPCAASTQRQPDLPCAAITTSSFGGRFGGSGGGVYSYGHGHGHGARAGRMASSSSSSSAPTAPSNSIVQELRGPPGQGRLAELLASFPLVTLAVTLLCAGVYVYCNAAPDFGAAVHAAAMVPALVLFDLQLFRLVTCAFTHLSMLHIGMNMMTLYSLGTSLERVFGSLHFLFLLLAYVALVGALFLPLAFLELLVWSPASFFGSAAGFSGVLFAMAVDESALSPAPTRSIFGLFSVPSRLYPWVLMLAISLAMPNVSLLGHLSGVLVGGAHVAGWLGWLLPSLPTLRKLEEQTWMRPLVRLQGYRLVPAADPVVVHNAAGGGAALALAAYACAPLTQCLGALSFCLRTAYRNEGLALAALKFFNIRIN